MIADKIRLLADEVINRFFDGESLNSAVINIAEREDLSPNLLQRLIEKSNEGALLRRVTEGENQNFDIADPDTIFSELNKPKTIEKTASCPAVSIFDYSCGHTKTAEYDHEKILPGELRMIMHGAMQKIAEDRAHHISRCNDVLSKMQKLTRESDMEKIASFMESKLEDQSEIGELSRKFSRHYTEAMKKERVMTFMEKDAAFWGAILKGGINLAGKTLSGVGTATRSAVKGLAPIVTRPKLSYTLKAGAEAAKIPEHLLAKGMTEAKWAKILKKKPKKIFKKAPELVAKTKGVGREFAPGRALNAAWIGGGLYGAGKNAYGTKIVTTMPKTAGAAKGLLSIAETPNIGSALKILLLTAAGGLAADAGFQGIKSTLQKRNLANTFNNIVENNPELGGADLQRSRDYFNSVARHAPSIAGDPLIAAQLLKQFQRFGGIDYRTIQDLRSTEYHGGPQKGNVIMDSMGNAGKILAATTGLASKLEPEEKGPLLIPTAEERGLGKTASLRGIATSKVKTYFGNSPEDIWKAKENEIIGGVRGKTIGGVLGGSAMAKMLWKKELPIKAKILLAGASAIASAIGGKSIGKAIGGAGKSVSTPVSFNAPRSEILQAAITNIEKKKGFGAYNHEADRTIWAGI